MNKIKVNCHAGHGCQGSNSPGANGYLSESVVNRQVVEYLEILCHANNENLHITTVDYPNNAKDCLNKIVANCNARHADIDISIHFNASSDKKGNGVECITYDSKTSANKYAKNICDTIASLGFRNRGVKHNKDYVVLKTKNPNIIVECCFIDNKEDCNKFNYKTMAEAIFKGIYGYKPITSSRPKNGIIYGNDVDYLTTEMLTWDKKEHEPCHIDQHYLWQYSNLIVVGKDAHDKMKANFSQENYHPIVGTDRWDTLRQALKFLNRY